MIQTSKRKKKRANLFITDNEVKLLCEYCSKHWGSKWQLLISFALLRGLRIGEIVAINILDFNEDYSKLRVVTSKTYIEDNLPLIPELTNLVKDYVLKNKHLLKDGYLFPYYTSKKKPHLTIGVAEAFFSKLRQQIGKDYPQFLEKANIGYNRFRIGLHSLRRYFETKIYDKTKDRKGLADIMRYLDTRTVDNYIDPYETWKKERDILEGVFDKKISFLRKIIDKEQKRLNNYIAG
jgi:integrase